MTKPKSFRVVGICKFCRFLEKDPNQIPSSKKRKNNIYYFCKFHQFMMLQLDAEIMVCDAFVQESKRDLRSQKRF